MTATTASATSTSNGPDRKRVLLLVLLVVAVAAIPGRIAWSMRSSALTQASETREQVRRLDEQVAQARHDKARAAELNDQLQALSAALPSEPDLASVVEQLEAVARESNVTFVSSAQAVPNLQGARAAAAAAAADAATPTTKPANATSATTLPSEDGSAGAADAPVATSVNYTVEVDVTGTKSNLAAFLEKLRAVPRVLTVERIQWTWQEGATGGQDTEVVAAHFSVRAYTWSGASKALAGATTVPAATPAPAATPGTKAP